MVKFVGYLFTIIKIIPCKYKVVVITDEIFGISNKKYVSCSKDQQIVIYPADVVLFEGILVFYFPAIRELFHMKLFVDMDSDMRLADRGIRLFNFQCLLYFIFFNFY